jgi:polysaccharide export outer membrane protein
VSASRAVPVDTTPLESGPVLAALLEDGVSVGIPVTGGSMRPTLLPGDRVIVAPFLGLPRPGQIVLARAAAGLVAHRLARVDLIDGRRVYRLQGEASDAFDAGVPREALLGRVVAVLRRGERRPIDEGPAALERVVRRLAWRRNRSGVTRRAAVLLVALLSALGLAGAAPPTAEMTYAPPPDYRFAPGDVLSLRVWDGERVDEKQLTVQSDGTAFLPILGLGSVEVGGKTAPEAKRDIEQKLGKIYKEIYIELLVLRYAGHRVHLMGEIKTTARIDSGPGEWPLGGPTRLVSFLSEHGGPSQDADLMRVQVVRRSGEKIEVNLFRAVFQQSEPDNPPLEDGDFVFVPSLAMGTRKVYVLGDVGQPGVVTIYDRMTLIEALARCGGINRHGTYKEIAVLKRRADQQPEMQVVNLREMVKTGNLTGDVELGPGDVVYVPRGALGTMADIFSIISPALNTIESLYIINDFNKNH